MVTKLKYSNCNKTKNSNCDKLKMWQKSTWIKRKRKKEKKFISIFDFFVMRFVKNIVTPRQLMKCTLGSLLRSRNVFKVRDLKNSMLGEVLVHLSSNYNLEEKSNILGCICLLLVDFFLHFLDKSRFNICAIIMQLHLAIVRYREDICSWRLPYL